MTARFSCATCGVTSPPLSPASVATVAKAHRCDELCPACGWRRAQRGNRGLCFGCHRTEARFDVPLKFRPAAELIEDVEWLLDDGYGLTGALERLGVEHAESLRRSLSRNGRIDLYDRLADREPDGAVRAKVRAAIRARSAA